MKYVALTGHRPNKIGGYRIPNPIYNFISKRIRQELQRIRPCTVISGMALGVDQIAAEISIDLGIPFIAAVPFIGQESKWPPKSQEHYKELIGKAEEVAIVSSGHYSVSKMMIRNEWMVDKCDLLIAVFDGSAGGTCNCVEYAISCKKEIVRINPGHFSIYEQATD